MIKLLKAIFSSGADDNKKLRDLNSLGELQNGDFIKLNDSFALPSELRGKTFQVTSIDSYFYGEELSTEWTLKGDTKKKIYMSLTDMGGEDQIVLSYQLNKREVDALFGWSELKAQMNASTQADLLCKDTSMFEGWLADTYHRREVDAEAVYFSRDMRGRGRSGGGEELTYVEFYNDDESRSMDMEIWDVDEIDVFISILRPETDVHEFWAG